MYNAAIGVKKEVYPNIFLQEDIKDKDKMYSMYVEGQLDKDLQQIEMALRAMESMDDFAYLGKKPKNLTIKKKIAKSLTDQLTFSMVNFVQIFSRTILKAALEGIKHGGSK